MRDDVASFSLLPVHVWHLVVFTYLCQVARSYASLLQLSDVVAIYVRRLITAADQTGCYAELIFIGGKYGIIPYITIRVGLFIWWSYAKASLDYDSCGDLENFVRGSESFLKTVLFWLVSFIGGAIAAYIPPRQMWWVKPSTHFDEPCFHNEVQVMLPLAMLTECLLTFAQRLHALYSEIYPNLASFQVIVLINTLINLMGMPFTGSYFNPVYATNIMIHCIDISQSNFFLIYWVSPIVGSMTALILYLLVTETRTNRPKFDEKLAHLRAFFKGTPVPQQNA